MGFDKINKKLDSINLPAKLPPIDGLAVFGVSWYLMRNDTNELRNASIIGLSHWVLHALIVNKFQIKCSIDYGSRRKRHSNRFRG